MMDWKDESLLSWASTPPSWAHSTILDWKEAFPREDELDVMKFVTAQTFEESVAIDMRLVVGQWEHYAGQTWLDALCSPQWRPGKMQNAIELADRNPAYYFNGEVKGGIHLSSVNGRDWYSNTDGNHRTVVAKFLSDMQFQKTGKYPLVAGVHTHTYEVDWESFSLFRALNSYKSIGIKAYVKHESLSDPLVFFVADYRFNHRGKFEHLTPDRFRNYAKWVLRNNGTLTRGDVLAHYWQWWFTNPEKLVFPTSN